MNQGLKMCDINLFLQLIVKANDEQIDKMKFHLENESKLRAFVRMTEQTKKELILNKERNYLD